MTEEKPTAAHSDKHVPKKMHKTISKAKVSNEQKERDQLKTFIFVISLVLAVAIGYVAGCYNRQIVAIISPVLGGKTYSADIDLSSVEDTYNELASRFDGTLDKAKLIEGASRGLVEAAGDDYTVFMSSKESTDFNDSLSGKIGGGIGAEIGLRNSKITIMRTLKNNAAEKAGLMANDIVLKVNDQSTEGWTVDKAVGLIRGDEGTTVKLSILRGTEVKEYTITRATINNPSVDSSVVDGIGIMTISRFDEETGSLARAAAQDFKTKGVKGVVLDLRGNGGGYVSAAKDVAGLWLDDKVVVTERVNNVVKSTIKSGNNAILSGLPTTVLVNGSSASASEIVAGALKDYGVAKLVGEKTFGKGSVQELVTLSGGSQIKVTIARWYTPKGKNINKEGITPDKVVSISQQDVDNGTDPQLDEAKKLLGL